ncbi:MAG: bacteriohemerythrin [Rhodospirillales bacterium]
MSYVSWNEKFSTGIKRIDEDHMGLFDLVDQFHEAYASGRGFNELDPVFEELMAYTERHFSYEEKMLEDAGYPDIETHREGHEHLKGEVENLYRRYKEGERTDTDSDLCLEILSFLSNWLHFHILEEDMNYREFLKEKK